MASTKEYSYMKTVKTTEYGEFIISKMQDVTIKETTTRCGFSFYKDREEIPVRGSVWYTAHTKEDSELQAMTKEYKTMKEVKAAIDNGEYIEY